MKIAVIGGAGVRTVIFINGLLKRYKKLHIDEVVLYDIQEEKQRIIERLCCHVVERKQEDLKVWAAKTPREALEGADTVSSARRPQALGDFPWQCARSRCFWNTAE